MSQQSRRITAAEVDAAYNKLGIMPLTCGWSIVKGEEAILTCGCPMAAVILAEHPELLEKERRKSFFFDSNIATLARSEFGEDYQIGFTNAVDTGKKSLDPSDFRPIGDRVLQGVEDGLAVRKHFAGKLYVRDFGMDTMQPFGRFDPEVGKELLDG